MQNRAAAPQAAVSGSSTVALIAIPVALWAGLVMAGGTLFGGLVLGALALQTLALVGLVMVASRYRPPRQRRERPRQMPRVETAALPADGW